MALAALLRTAHGLARWEETAWRYAGYPAETLEALAAGAFGRLAGTFTGLHPPLWPLLHSLSEIWAPVPLLWLGAGVLCSVGAVALTAAENPKAGLLLAASPIQVHYCAEVNQYPLAVLWVALAWLLAGRRRPIGLGLAVALAGWTHLLAGVVALLAVLRLSRRQALLAGVVAVLLLVPLAVPVLGVLGDDATFRQPAFSATLVAADWRARFGLAGAGVLGLAALGARHRPRMAIGIGCGAVVFCGLVAARIAAPHQFPYASLFGPPLALLAAAGLPALGRKATPALGLLVAALAVGGLRVDGAALFALADAGPRGIDVALAELERPWTCLDTPARSCSGDALVLLSPPGINDDDKRQHSATLWRLRPWWPMPRVVPPGLDWTDHRSGHPRRVGGHVVYVLDHPRDTVPRLLEAHERVWLVVYDQGQKRSHTTDLTAALGVAPDAVGTDWLYRLARGPALPAKRVVQDGPPSG